MDEKIFKAYDIRGVYPDEINEKAVKSIAKAYVQFIKPKTVAVGRDVRLSSPSLQKAVIEGLTESGVDVIDIGMGPTEMIYFAVGAYEYDGGIQVSASHNPAKYNGLKLIKAGVEGISSDTGLREIQKLAENTDNYFSKTQGNVAKKSIEGDYFDFLKQFAQFKDVRHLKVVANNNFGLSGPLMKRFLTYLNAEQVELVELNFKPDGSFPKGPPSPQVVENRAEVSQMIRQEKADFGVSWDADGDRCFFADESGEFIQGCHLTALFAELLLKEHPGEKIIYDTTNVLAVEGIVKKMGGQALVNRVGHTFIKKRMKVENALFGGENSGHSYFREFYSADNGIIPLLLFLNTLATYREPVSRILAQIRTDYPVSGEINFPVKNTNLTLENVEKHYKETGSIDMLDGLSMRFNDWRFNLRPSNTEPLLRLNVEGKNKQIVDKKTAELKSLIKE